MSTPKDKNRCGIQRQNWDKLYSGLRQHYFDIAMGRFTWKNLPKNIPIRYPEKYLYENAMCVFFQPDGLDYMILPVATGDIQKNVWGEPSKWRATAVGEYSGRINAEILDATNSVLMRNDSSYRSTADYVNVLINQMVNVEFTMRMNINAQKMPMVFKSDENTALQDKNTFFEYMESEPVFFKSKMSKEEFEIFYSGVPLIAKDLASLYEQYDARIMNHLGVDCLPIEKKERMVVDEVNINGQKNSLILENYMSYRKLACDEINKLFSLNVSVEYNMALEDGQIANDRNIKDKEGEKDETV